MDETERFLDALSAFPPEERAKISAAIMKTREYGMGQTVAEAVMTTVTSAARVVRKKERDRVADNRRRTLIGARLSRSFVEKCKADAQRRGMSLYAWVKMALEQMFD